MKVKKTSRRVKILKALCLTIAVICAFVLLVAFVGFMWHNHIKILMWGISILVLLIVGSVIFSEIYDELD